AEYDSLLRKAKRLSATGFHEEAVQIYEKVLGAVEKGYFPKAQLSDLLEKKIRYLLVEENYTCANFQRAAQLSESENPPQDQIDRELLYLCALSYKKWKQYEEALAHFLDYTSCALPSQLDHYDNALFEVGYQYYRAKNFAEARRYFTQLLEAGNKKKKPCILAAIYLARMHLSEANCDKVETLLAPFCESLPQRDPLRCELFYLRGEAAYAREDFASAQELYSLSIPQRGQGAWRFQAFYKLGLSYMKLGDDVDTSAEERAQCFSQAEELFERLLPTSESELATLALAHLHLTKSEHDNKVDAYNKMCSLILPRKEKLSSKGELEALLLLAEAAPNYEEREHLYAQATENRFKNLPSYAKAWCARGLNHFQKGVEIPEMRSDCYQLATSCFEHAFLLIDAADVDTAAHILKLEAKVNFFKDSSYAILETLLHKFIDTKDLREESLYLRGLIASRLTSFALAQDSLSQLVSLYPQGKLVPDSLFILGSLNFKQEDFLEAERIFLQLAQNYPESQIAGDAWYWASVAAEKRHEPHERVLRLRRQVYENYRESNFAPEAYFQQYSYIDYLEGKSEALAHLMPFSQLFEYSPLQIIVHYLMGVNASSAEKAQWRFNEAISAFNLYSKEKSPDISSISD
ncbi:MAG: tetratricopeptide repeat protein, partial [Chlamydiales bacterium]